MIEELPRRRLLHLILVLIVVNVAPLASVYMLLCLAGRLCLDCICLRSGWCLNQCQQPELFGEKSVGNARRAELDSTHHKLPSFIDVKMVKAFGTTLAGSHGSNCESIWYKSWMRVVAVRHCLLRHSWRRCGLPFCQFAITRTFCA